MFYPGREPDHSDSLVYIYICAFGCTFDFYRRNEGRYLEGQQYYPNVDKGHFVIFLTF
jgi:hypothetical protein